MLTVAPALAQPNDPPPVEVPTTLRFTKDPNPPLVPPTPVAPPAAAPKSSVRILPRALFPRKETPQVPASSPATMHFTKEAPTAPGAAPVAATPALHFAKEATKAPATVPVVATPALHFAKEATPPAAAPVAATPSLHFAKEATKAPAAAPVAATPALHFAKEATKAPAAAPVAATPALRFAKEAKAPAAAPVAATPALRFAKEATTASPMVVPRTLRFAKEAAPSAFPLRPGNQVLPRQLPPRGVVRVAMQAAPNNPQLPPVPDNEAYAIQLNPPGPQRVFQLRSERDFQARMKQEALQRGQRVEFPPEPIVSTESYAGRNFPPLSEIVEPGYVCYHRLFFEERNAERYDWNLGFIQPLVSVGYFYKDFLLLPYHMFTDPCRKFDCDAGYCLPGDPVPYLLYPPALSVTGAIAEAGAVFTVLALLPG